MAGDCNRNGLSLSQSWKWNDEQFEIMSTQYCQCFVLFATYEQAGQGVVVVDYIDIYFLVFILFVISSSQS